MASPKILVVEDHQDTLDFFVVVLSHLNYEVVSASTVAEALEATRKQTFDLLILDSHLSDGTGTDLCRRIREKDRTTAILFCSADAYDKNREEALNAGAQAYLVKPITIAEMGNSVRELLSSSRRHIAPVATNPTHKDSGDLAAPGAS